MLQNYATPILYVTGAITASMVLQFLAPAFYLKQTNKITINSAEGLFFARHWGLTVALIGGLLIWAAAAPELRTPVLTIALIGKSVFVGMIVANIKGFGKGLVLALVFDSITVLLYAGLLLGL